MTIRSEIINYAVRRLSLKSLHDSATAEQYAYASKSLDALFSELVDDGLNVDWTPDTAPEAVRRPLGWLVAVDIAPQFSLASEPRSRAMGRLRAALFPDDRTDRRDLDGDGTVSEAEVNAGLQANYY